MNHPYFTAKITDLLRTGRIEIDKAVGRVLAEFSKDGRLQSGAAQWQVQQAVEVGFRKTLDTAGQLLIDSEVQSQTEIAVHLRREAKELAEHLVVRHGLYLFGKEVHPDFSQSETATDFLGTLYSITDLTIEGLQHDVIGARKATRATPIHKTVIGTQNNSTITGSRNVVQQAGVKARQSNEQWDPGPLRAHITGLLTDLDKVRANGDDIQDLRAQLESLKAQLNARAPEPGIVQSLYRAAKNIASRLGDRALEKAFEFGVEYLPTVLGG